MLGRAAARGSMPAVSLPIWGGVDTLQSSSSSLIALGQVVGLPRGYTPQKLLGSVASLPHHACTSSRRVLSAVLQIV